MLSKTGSLGVVVFGVTFLLAGLSGKSHAAPSVAPVVALTAAPRAGAGLGPPLTAASTPAAPAGTESPAAEGRYYSDTFMPLREDVRAFERDPANRYTYCIRNVGTYECLSYGSDGIVHRQQYQTTAHGTGFAYQLDGDQTRLLTNEHVVSWPYVTEGQHRVEDVPLGCKLVSQKLSIVDNDDDDYEADDIPLTRVVDDRALDAAVVVAKSKLRLLPYRVGHASALSTGDVVVVRGFPLGVFQAYNTGSVINTYDHDQFQQWDHEDFIVDAQLSSGNSGSPVLALNRRSGEYELVGIFHASYTRANALNAVIGIDQLQDLMFKLKVPSRQRLNLDAEQLPDGEQRRRLQKALTEQEFVPYLALGPLFVRLHALGDSLLFEVFSGKFPLDDHRVAFLLDTPEAKGWGKLQRVWLGDGRGFRLYNSGELDAESAEPLSRVLHRLYALASSTRRYRQEARSAIESRQAAEQRTRVQRALTRAAAADPDLAQLLVELSAKRAPASTEPAVSLAEVYAQIQPAPIPGVPIRSEITKLPEAPKMPGAPKLAAAPQSPSTATPLLVKPPIK